MHTNAILDHDSSARRGLPRACPRPRDAHAGSRRQQGAGMGAGRRRRRLPARHPRCATCVETGLESFFYPARHVST